MIDNLPDYPALRAIQDALWHVSDVRGAAVMVGSGFSMNAELASPTSKRPPLWSDMASAMKAQLGDGSSGTENPLRLAEEFRALLGQAALDGLVRDLVPDSEWLPGHAHRRLLKLPWSDVLSTNWDTLLERAQTELTERSYDPVSTPADISRTRSPRIVKLHGTLPSHTPFIFAEEDYRTFPAKFAPFVNLAQHVLLENELLLLGFSGDDPNFLAWAGWVRDQLGTSARKIRLAGVLNLTTARRRYLENLNVTPIDLAPLVDDVTDVATKHVQATKLLLDSLHAAKPKPPQVWDRCERPDDEQWKTSAPEVRVAKIVEDWKQDRLAAPDWLLAPFYDRYRLRQETADTASKALADLDKITPALRTRLVAELAWRLDIGHFGVPSWARQVMATELEDKAAELSPCERLLILRMLCYDAIERRDSVTYTQSNAALATLAATDPEAKAWGAYLRGLWARGSLDLAGIEECLTEIAGNDPVWLLRKASLHCELRQSASAARLVRDALIEIRRRRAMDRHSLWLISREAWAQFLWQSLSFELDKDTDRGIEPVDEWPIRYKELRVDPWDELTSQESEIRSEQDRENRYSGKEKTHFDAGLWTPPAKGATHWVASWVASPEWSLRRLADWIGLPVGTGSFDIIGGRLTRAIAGRTEPQDDAALWRICTYLRSSKDELIDRWFGRLNVAAMSEQLISDLTTALCSSINYLANALQEKDDLRSNRVEYLRTHLELLSRLSVRSEPDKAREFFELALSVVERGGDSHWWLFEPVAHLIKRSLSASPQSERGKYVGAMLAFPLPGERNLKGNIREWPEFADEFRASAIKVERPDKEWDARIAELTARIEKSHGEDRHRAISRLWLLDLKNLLTDAEKEKFAAALWSQKTCSDGLPKDQHFYPAVFLQLPEPKQGMAAKAFDHDVVQPFLAGKNRPEAWESLAYIGSETDKGRAERPISEDTARDLIAMALDADQAKLDEEAYNAIAYGLLPIVALDDGMATKLWERAQDPGATDALLFIPYIVKNDPGRKVDAVARLRRAMNSRDFKVADRALSSVRQWAMNVNAAAFPPALASSVASIVSIRRDPGLFRALDVCADLLRMGLLSDEDIEGIIDGLAELLIETDYGEWRQGDFRTATLTYIRANALRLARQLRASGKMSQVVEDWIKVGEIDPVPEVRFVTDRHE